MSVLFKYKPLLKTVFVNTCRRSNVNLVFCKNFRIFKMGRKFEVLPTPIKSDSDKKEYKVIRLKNGLTACLISDKSPITETNEMDVSDSETASSTENESGSESSSESEHAMSETEESPKKSLQQDQKLAAAALCISVGSFNDPPEVPGMAHFLEHMVFMGSEKFPMENDFDAFIKKSGGSDNASTDTEVTTFYFEILEKHLPVALDKFAQFFISPLMKKEAMTREMESIDSEFNIAVPSDSSRKEQLLNNFAQKNSPVNSFPWGNLETLRDNISADKLYSGVHEFRKRHYSAHRMTLAIQARLPMETLEDYVVDCFSNVPNNKLPKPDLTSFSSTVYDTPEFKKIYYVKPTKDLCQIDLIWALPPIQGKYRSKPGEYIACLLGDEGKGSVLSYLRKKVWVLGISVGNGNSGVEDNSIFSFFTVSLVATEEGMEHVTEIIDTIFAYLNLLKKVGPQKRYFDEIKAIWDTSFKYSTEEPAVDFVEDLCEKMHVLPPEHYLCGKDLLFDYDPKQIEEVLQLLSADKMCVLLMSTKFPPDIVLNQTEKWFGVQYTSKEIPREQIEKWNNMEPIPELQLPEPNKFITEDFAILPPLQDNPSYPTLILNSPHAEIWYRKDDKFQLPKAYYNIYLISPVVNTAASHCMLDMLYNLLEIDVSEELYPAVSAELHYKFTSYEKSLMLKVSGFNEKLPMLINILFDHMKNIHKNIRLDLFEALKMKMINGYHNKLIKPSNLAKDLRLNCLVDNHSVQFDKYEASLSITHQQMVEFAENYFKKLFLKVLVQGNVTEELAKSTIEKAIRDLNSEALPRNLFPTYSVIQLPKGEKCCRAQSLNKNDSNSVVTNYYQSGPITLKDNVILEIIMLAIEEPLFDTLRTKEQLGYSVSSSIRDTFGVLGYTITVNTQANKFTTQHVDKRIEAFIKAANKILKSQSNEELEVLKTTLVKMKQTIDIHLKEEVDRNWTEIVDNEYLFNRLQQEIEILKTIKRNEILSWWNNHNEFGDKSKFKKLTIQVVGHKKNEQSMEITDSGDPPETLHLILLDDQKNKGKDYFIKNIEEFKAKAAKYPVKTERIPK